MPNGPNSAMAEIGEVHEREEGVIEWTVRDFFSLPARVGVCFSCPTFPLNGAQWYLKMYPNGERKEEEKSERYIEIYLVRQSIGSPIQLNFFLGLKTSKNEIEEETHHIHYFEKRYDKCMWARFIKRSTLLGRQSELAPSGHLTWICRLKNPPSTDATSAIPTAKCAHCKETIGAGSLPSHEMKCLDKPIQCPECSEVVALKHWYAHDCQPAKSKDKSSAPVVKSKILEDFKQLLQNQENCDVILRVKGQEFPAHKIILTARSSVFASAFRNDMKEKATGVVDIEDCEPSTFSDFLRFLYCEDVEGLSNETVYSLFFVADKYDVSDLRGKCLEFMTENLSVETFCDTLTLALRHSDTELVRFATDFFVANADKIIVTVAWQTFAVENPIQSNELFIKFVASVKH